ncbi:hypothetical protein CDCA_CDCA09G2757 [Cyanidium caldarium]|uniref:Cupin type-1 domain-containing protein n=1 Tax=Cyanidium caldarium TaxID=2771 RepID=A0AAV9IWM3_CYACA|nr:hypothetical protein CDCA_CDCA09G2757 [Cyanidium caldarium]
MESGAYPTRRGSSRSMWVWAGSVAFAGVLGFIALVVAAVAITRVDDSSPSTSVGGSPSLRTVSRVIQPSIESAQLLDFATTLGFSDRVSTLQAGESNFAFNFNTEAEAAVSNSFGSFRLVTGAQNSLLYSIGLSNAVVTLEKCALLEWHAHVNCIEYDYVISGSGYMSMWSANGSLVLDQVPMQPGDVFVIPPGWPHVQSASSSSSGSPLIFEATFTSGDPQVYFLAGVNSIFNEGQKSQLASDFNVTGSEYSGFFGAATGGGIIFNRTCSSS